MTLFDTPSPEHQSRIDRARAERDAALEAVEIGAGETWTKVAWEYLVDYLIHNEYLFTDDIWQTDTNPDGLAQPPTTMRALGPLVLRAARAGHIVKTGRYRPRTFGHAAEGPVWRSTLYVAPEVD